MTTSPDSAHSVLKLLATIVFALLVSGCGFQLRGQADLQFERIYVETSGFSLFAAELRRAIQSNKSVEVMKSPEDAQVVLRVLDESREKKILALTSTGSVEEYVLLYRVNYRVLNNKMTDLVAPNAIMLQRIMTYKDTETLAKESEEEFLFRDMQADAVQQLLRRLSVVPISS
ncbi:MAG: LPS assembly lipoprotein LptE [Burkholderiales bacterium]|jgi:LPS-assembly lipoprotein